MGNRYYGARMNQHHRLDATESQHDVISHKLPIPGKMVACRARLSCTECNTWYSVRNAAQPR